jgi:phenylpropionate dioxygenase-like ring-hydroxylating dioxygenase large terminal subunit
VASPAKWDYLDSITPQLPVSWYVDRQIFDTEQRLLFDDGIGYVGHELMVPQVGSYHTIGWMDDGWMLVRSDTGVGLLSNVCRHRQAMMLEGRGVTRNIVCPIHRWSYNLRGNQIAAPHFDDNPCRNLPVRPLTNWQGLLFAGQRDIAAELADFGLAREFDFSGYTYQTTWIEDYPINWKTFIEIYMELYHVEAFHPGLKGFVDARQFEPDDWQFAPTWSNQIMRLHAAPDRSNSEAYRKYWAAVPGRGGRGTSSSSTTRPTCSSRGRRSSSCTRRPTSRAPRRMARSSSTSTGDGGPCTAAASRTPARIRSLSRPAWSISTTG